MISVGGLVNRSMSSSSCLHQFSRLVDFLLLIG